MKIPKTTNRDVTIKPWRCRNQPMGMPQIKPWRCRNQSMEMPHSKHGDATTNPWRCHNQPMEMPQSTHGDASTNPWRCHNQHLDMPRSTHGMCNQPKEIPQSANRQNSCYHVAAFVIPFNLVCNMTMF